MHKVLIVKLGSSEHGKLGHDLLVAHDISTESLRLDEFPLNTCNILAKDMKKCARQFVGYGAMESRNGAQMYF